MRCSCAIMLNDAAWDRIFPHLETELATFGYAILEASRLKALSGQTAL